MALDEDRQKRRFKGQTSTQGLVTDLEEPNEIDYLRKEIRELNEALDRQRQELLELYRRLYAYDRPGLG